MEKPWSISVAESVLDKAAGLSLIFGGRKPAHSYLVLRNGEGDIVSELHGTTYNPERNRFAYGGFTWRSFLAAIADDLHLTPVFRAATQALGRDKKYSLLKVAKIRDHWAVYNIDHETPVYHGDKTDVMARWLAGCAAANAVNEQSGTTYKPFGLAGDAHNCHGVTKALGKAMEIEINKGDLHYSHPGFNYDLSKEVPALKAIAPNFSPAETDLDEALAAQLYRSRKLNLDDKGYHQPFPPPSGPDTRPSL